MKVFEVITEYSEADSNKIITQREYVTSSDNKLTTVADYFAKHCYEYEKELKGVAEVLTIVQNIKHEAE